MPKFITEALGGTELTGHRMLIDIITPGWGSSGYYSESVLAQAATDRVFPAGTQMHVDHPTSTESAERPERSIQTLAAVLEEDAFFAEGKLRAYARVYPMWRESLAAMASAIGVSIRSAAEFVFGEAENRKGNIVESLLPNILNTVDFVTVAGRGGKIAMVLESGGVATEARNIGMWLEARMHSMFTNLSDEFYGDGKLTREERITLSNALGDALAGFTAKVEADAPQLFERDLWDEPDAVNSASESTSAESKEKTMANVEIDEAELSRLQSVAARVEVAESTLDTERQERAAERAAVEATRTAANRSLAESIATSAFGTQAPITQRALVAEALTGEFDAEAFVTVAREAAAELAVAGGAGSVQGMGFSKGANSGISREATAGNIARAFGRVVQEGSK